MSTFSLGSSTLYTMLEETLLSFFLKAVPSNFFSLSSFLKAGNTPSIIELLEPERPAWQAFERDARGRKFGHETAREGEGGIKVFL